MSNRLFFNLLIYNVVVKNVVVVLEFRCLMYQNYIFILIITGYTRVRVNDNFL